MVQSLQALTGQAVTKSTHFYGESATATSLALKRPVLPGYLLRSYQRLAELAALQEDWDSYGALPISEKALDGARRLLSRVCRELPSAADASPFALAPLANGGVQIEWRGAHGALELEVDPKGRLSGLLVGDHETGRSYEERSRLSMTVATRLVSRTLGL